MFRYAINVKTMLYLINSQYCEKYFIIVFNTIRLTKINMLLQTIRLKVN